MQEYSRAQEKIKLQEQIVSNQNPIDWDSVKEKFALSPEAKRVRDLFLSAVVPPDPSSEERNDLRAKLVRADQIIEDLKKALEAEQKLRRDAVQQIAIETDKTNGLRAKLIHEKGHRTRLQEAYLAIMSTNDRLIDELNQAQGEISRLKRIIARQLNLSLADLQDD